MPIALEKETEEFAKTLEQKFKVYWIEADDGYTIQETFEFDTQVEANSFERGANFGKNEFGGDSYFATQESIEELGW